MVTLNFFSYTSFSTHDSFQLAIEWIQHLRALVRFWTRRHRVDARMEMDLMYLSTGKPRFEIPRATNSRQVTPPALPDPQAAAQSMGSFWTWCVLDVCRPIVKAGRLYLKSRPRNHYKHMYMILIPGHVVLFHVTATKSGYHHHSRTVNLVDSYIYSGALIASHLPTLFDTTAPRRYQDGLETNDSDLDTTFIIRYRSHPNGWDKMENDEGVYTVPRVSSDAIPQLNAKHGLLILKARSKLERDAWCWALNSEIERIVRTKVDREKGMRAQPS